MMQVLRTVSELRAVLRARGSGDLGLVPTMGSLHAGHLELVRRARADNAEVLCTIFVNRAQFNDAAEYERYPRALKADLEVLQEAAVDYVFVPTEAEMYPAGAECRVTVPDLRHAAEVQARPGHFDGVATIVTKLLALIQPERAYFGMKDYCQLRLVTLLARSLLFQTEIVPVATVRDADGLALSSRNRLLSAEQRGAAPILYNALVYVSKMWERGIRKGQLIRRAVEDILSSESLLKLDYVSVADADTLREVQDAAGDTVVSVAAYFGEVRLIDNLVLEF